VNRSDALRMMGRLRAQLPNSGELYRVHQWIATLPLDMDTSAQDRCAGCGTALVQSERGRRRRWCSESCRTRARRK
jgi:hypothetical protein